jgi:hypothetical protein
MKRNTETLAPTNPTTVQPHRLTELRLERRTSSLSGPTPADERRGQPSPNHESERGIVGRENSQCRPEEGHIRSIRLMLI